ncbi:hypothetical protein BJ944DRAFT_262002 [Cunninghamella echinulata]|nr:hypothetical protein BJ944DRAFT_262002 [Cunninghamella echinulata]
MPPKKEFTPHQISQGLTYIHKEPAFLAKLKGVNKAQEQAKQKFENYIDGQDDEDYDELDGAQVVELDRNGKEIHKDIETKNEDEENDKESKDDKNEKEEEDNRPVVDENGRILFRSKKKSSAKRQLQDIIDGHKKKDDEKSVKKQKKKKKQQPLTLSFNPDE